MLSSVSILSMTRDLTKSINKDKAKVPEQYLYNHEASMSSIGYPTVAIA